MALFDHIEFEIEDANGNTYPLEHPWRHVTEMSGLGLPPIRHWTTRAPFQQGRSHWGYAFQPRVVNVGFLTDTDCRTEFWKKRLDFVDVFNPMNGPHKLRLYREDRHTFELHDVWYNSGFDFRHGDQDPPFLQMSTIQLVINDPFFKWTTVDLESGQTRDSDGRVCVTAGTFTTQDELTVPFTGPFLLGVTIGTATITAVNNGTWAAKPVITITGPLSDWSLTNDTNGKQITWDGYVIADDEVVTISVPDKTATNGAGDDLTSYVGGDIGSFVLDPGSNTLSFWCADIDDTGLYWLEPEVQVCWYAEILGT